MEQRALEAEQKLAEVMEQLRESNINLENVKREVEREKKKAEDDKEAELAKVKKELVIMVKQNCSYQGEALKVPTTFLGLWSITKISMKKKEKKFLKNLRFYVKTSPHTSY